MRMIQKSPPPTAMPRRALTRARADASGRRGSRVAAAATRPPRSGVSATEEWSAGQAMLAAMPKAIPPRLISSGMIWWSRSTKKTTTMLETKATATAKAIGSA